MWVQQTSLTFRKPDYASFDSSAAAVAAVAAAAFLALARAFFDFLGLCLNSLSGPTISSESPESQGLRPSYRKDIWPDR